ncbi:MAG: DUF4270 domain-containing protein [Bacteroidaceae bacterium]|nr:DUF4270 domain-containing protein [Bacteroidaceae bacterium]
MNIKAIVCGFLSVLMLNACDSNTSTLGNSLTPESDEVRVKADSCFAVTRSIQAPDSILLRTTVSCLGKYTDPTTGAILEANYLTQINCVEDFSFPDSVYGIGDFDFPDWFDKEMRGEKPYYAELNLYFQSVFGDKNNALKLDVYLLDEIIDPNRRYYANVNPADFYDEDSDPIASVMVSPIDYSLKDSLLESDNYYHSISIGLPDYIAKDILEKYYSPDGKKYFADVTSFMENVCKGFYVKCSQGDGTLVYVDKSVLGINFKYLEPGDSVVSSVIAEFSGNNEVMQINSFRNMNQDMLLNDNSCTYLRTPFGILTEVELPIDEMKKSGGVLLNSASVSFSKINVEQPYYPTGTPSRLMLVRKSELHDFFEHNNTADNITSYATTFNTKYNTYTFDNIAKLVELCYAEREDWVEANGYSLDVNGFKAYANAFPEWNKAVLVPVKPKVDSNNTIVGYILDVSVNQIKLLGGELGDGIKIKTIYTSFE